MSEYIEIDISTKTQKNAILILDAEDYEWAKKFKWTPEKRNNTLYAVRPMNNTVGKRYLVRIHRDVVRARSFEQVDHINLNGLDNKKSNLRICTNSLNQHNSIKRKTDKSNSQYRGVFRRESGNYFAYISHDKKRYYLGTFEKESTAARKYDSKALELYGPLARLNFALK